MMADGEGREGDGAEENEEEKGEQVCRATRAAAKLNYSVPVRYCSLFVADGDRDRVTTSSSTRTLFTSYDYATGVN